MSNQKIPLSPHEVTYVYTQDGSISGARAKAALSNTRATIRKQQHWPASRKQRQNTANRLWPNAGGIASDTTAKLWGGKK